MTLLPYKILLIFQSLCLYIYTYILYIYVYTYIIYICIYMYIYVYICIYIYVYKLFYKTIYLSISNLSPLNLFIYFLYRSYGWFILFFYTKINRNCMLYITTICPHNDSKLFSLCKTTFKSACWWTRGGKCTNAHALTFEENVKESPHRFILMFKSVHRDIRINFHRTFDHHKCLQCKSRHKKCWNHQIIPVRIYGVHLPKCWMKKLSFWFLSLKKVGL